MCPQIATVLTALAPIAQLLFHPGNNPLPETQKLGVGDDPDGSPWPWVCFEFLTPSLSLSVCDMGTMMY